MQIRVQNVSFGTGDANSTVGPWAVATSVPVVIYTIPISSPLHYVTYVKVYGSTPEVVYVGYTPINNRRVQLENCERETSVRCARTAVASETEVACEGDKKSLSTDYADYL